MTTQPIHCPLHLLEATPAHVSTAGRLCLSQGRWHLANAHTMHPLVLDAAPNDTPQHNVLWRVVGRYDGESLYVTRVLWSSPPPTASPTIDRGRPRVVRAQMEQCMHDFFNARDFLHVRTPHWVESAGTDVYLAPFASTFIPEEESEHIRPQTGYLHTSPEFAMKQLLVRGHERIYQLARVWRNGEVTTTHQPEFTMLEWYRAWEGIEDIMQDVEELTRLILPATLTHAGHCVDMRAPFTRMTMQQLVRNACGFDILEALTLEHLQRANQDHSLGLRADARNWEDMFFELQVTYLDPMIATLGAVFITDWPAPLAVLAKRHPEDPRRAGRFELYVAGLELANGFDELTDPHEQRARFEQDSTQRDALGFPPMPMPTRFLNDLDAQMPPSGGVAMGVERLVMLAAGLDSIEQVAPLGFVRTSKGVDWGV